MTALGTVVPAASGPAARAVAVHAFWRHARFGTEAARRGDRIVAAPHRLALIEMEVHGPAWLAARAAAARAAMDAAMPPRHAPEPPVELMEPAPLAPLPAPPSAPAATPFDPSAAWLHTFW